MSDELKKVEEVSENKTNSTKATTEISNSELAELYTKAKEYDIIIGDYKALLSLSSEKGLSVPELINYIRTSQREERLKELTKKCNGDTELASHILNLETTSISKGDGFSELKEFFPKFNDVNQLPLSVTENARLRGTLLLDEYLRYLLNEDFKTKTALAEQQNRDRASTGSQTTKKSEINPEAAEFLRGLWK